METNKFIHLQPEELNGVADCGCRLDADTDGPSIILCDLHAAAPKLYNLLKEIQLSNVSGSNIDIHEIVDEIPGVLDEVRPLQLILTDDSRGEREVVDEVDVSWSDFVQEGMDTIYALVACVDWPLRGADGYDIDPDEGVSIGTLPFEAYDGHLAWTLQEVK